MRIGGGGRCAKRVSGSQAPEYLLKACWIMLMQEKGNANAHWWGRRCLRALSAAPGAAWTQVGLRQLSGMLVLVFARQVRWLHKQFETPTFCLKGRAGQCTSRPAPAVRHAGPHFVCQVGSTVCCKMGQSVRLSAPFSIDKRESSLGYHLFTAPS